MTYDMLVHTEALLQRANGWVENDHGGAANSKQITRDTIGKEQVYIH